ncbi:DNA-binding response regulator [Paenibacillaceae bacterium]|nr:DNA-binding response regulator [Paenibacillaceae bacterium]
MGDQQKLLLIEDEESIRDILCYALRGEGYHVKSAATGAQGLQLLEQFQPDALLLDVMLPDTSGFELCKHISARYSLPILMLTARNEMVDKILGLELGADDYITKPFELREVSARIKAVLRRREKAVASSKAPSCRVRLSLGIELDPEAYAVYKTGEEVKLKPKEFELLLLFWENPNRVFSREEILDRVWEMDYDGDLRTVDVHVQRIRKKLDASLIETVFGVGYKRSEG